LVFSQPENVMGTTSATKGKKVQAGSQGRKAPKTKKEKNANNVELTERSGVN